MARALLAKGVLATGFFYPVVPQGRARIRTQMSAALGDADLDRALDAFARAGRSTGAIP
jgi:glycine C-acetyltransferase